MPAQPAPRSAPPAFSPVPQAPPSSGNMDGHIKALGAVQIVFGALALVGALVLFATGGFAGDAIEEEGGEEGAADFFRALMGIIGTLLLVYGALGIVGAIGLFGLKPWGRGVSLAFHGISLVNVPFGTALGIWGLIALTRPEAAQLFRQGGAAA